MAWRRTTLSATAVTVLTARLALQRHNIVVIALAGLCWVFLLVVVQQRIRDLRTPDRPTRWFTMLTAAACMALGALGVVLILLEE